MKIKGDFVLREIAGDMLLIPTGKTALEFNGMITVNKVGAIIWNGLTKSESKETIVKGILDEFEVDENTASQDFDEFVDGVKKAGFLED